MRRCDRGNLAARVLVVTPILGASQGRKLLMRTGLQQLLWYCFVEREVGGFEGVAESCQGARN